MTRHSNKLDLIVLFTDFGSDGLYIGQMKAVLGRLGVGLPIVDLMTDAPLFNPRASAYLINALAASLPSGALFLAVVDPGVGGDRDALIVYNGSHWFIGPDNGLLSQVYRSSDRVEIHSIGWRPTACSESFHGRDIFAPVAAGVCRGELPAGSARDPQRIVGADWPKDLAEVIYIDHFGNALTGVRGQSLDRGLKLWVKGRQLPFARTFSEVPEGDPFWYVNSLGLVELAVNRGSADTVLGVAVGEPVEWR